MKFNISLLASITICLAIQCKNEQGKNVGWYFIYKLPSDVGGPKDGYSYLYFTNRSLMLSRKGIDEHNSIVAKTLSAAYRNKDKYTYLLYSDDPPHSEANSHRAHSKGALIVDKSRGLLLEHTVPNFPSLMNSYSYPSTARHYGQTLLCISFSTSETFNKILMLLLLIRPFIYEFNATSDLKKKFPNLQLLEESKWLQTLQNPVKIKTVDNLNVDIFGKSPKQNFDFFSEVLATYYNTDIFVQSWRRGAGKYLSNACKIKHSTYNILGIKVKNDIEKWGYLKDHSKWAVSKEQNVKLVCFCDLNRMQSQFKRGGLFICLQSKNLWNTMRNLVKEYEQC